MEAAYRRLLGLFTTMREEQGQALAEYGLLLTFIAVACLVAVTALGLAIAGQFGSVTGSF
jgi:Flp pilus assembly pilin Flp